MCRKLLDLICRFSFLKRCSYSLYSDTMLNIGRVRMKQTQMYVCTLEEFILDDLHYLMYKLELRYCVENTLVFIQSQQ